MNGAASDWSRQRRFGTARDAAWHASQVGGLQAPSSPGLPIPVGSLLWDRTDAFCSPKPSHLDTHLRYSTILLWITSSPLHDRSCNDIVNARHKSGQCRSGARLKRFHTLDHALRQGHSADLFSKPTL